MRTILPLRPRHPTSGLPKERIKESHESHKPNQAPSTPSGMGPPGNRHAPPPHSPFPPRPFPGVGHSARPEPSRRVSRAEWVGPPPQSSPTHQPLQALPKGPTPTPKQRSITVPVTPSPRDHLWKVPGHTTACPPEGQSLPLQRPPRGAHLRGRLSPSRRSG